MEEGKNIFDACKQGRLDIVKCLIEKGIVSVDEKDQNVDYGGWTPLHYASENGYFYIVQYLIDHGADVNCYTQIGLAALHCASNKGHFEIVQCLIQNGANINCQNQSQQTPLFLACQNGNLELFDYLVENNACLDTQDASGHTPLHCASDNNRLEIVQRLVNLQADVNKLDSCGQTPLHLAGKRGYLNIVQHLFENKADLNIQGSEGTTPLHEASMNGFLEVVQFLIANGAHVNCIDKFKRTPLHFASGRGHLQVVQYLIDNEANINCLNKAGQLPLHYASENALCLDIAKYLITKHTDINHPDNRGQTPLHCAINTGLIQTAEYLIEIGANVNCQDKYGDTLLHSAADGDLIRVVRALVQHGANCNAVNSARTGILFPIDFCMKEKNTPLYQAIMLNRISIAKFLIDHTEEKNLILALHAAADTGSVELTCSIMSKLSNLTTEHWRKNSPIHVAAAKGFDKIVHELVQFPWFDCKNETGQTALEVAEENKNIKVAEILKESLEAYEAWISMEKGDVDWNKQFTYDNLNLLHLAARRGSEFIAKKAIDHGFDINSEAWLGATPLTWASLNGYMRMVKYLTSIEGCDINKLSLWGGCERSPLQWSIANQHYEIAGFLIDSGAETQLLWKENLILEIVAPFLKSVNATADLVMRDLPIELTEDGSVVEKSQHYFSWTKLLDPLVPVDASIRSEVVNYILQSNKFKSVPNKAELYRALAYSKDKYGRQAIYMTDPSCRDIFNKLLFFCGRYEIFDGPPVHVSATSIVVYAYDHGLCNEVYDKFSTEGNLTLHNFIKCNDILGRLNRTDNLSKKNINKKWEQDFQYWDKDNNGHLSKEEFLKYCDQWFDGKIKIAMKFMRNKQEFDHERENRLNVNEKYVVGLLPCVSEDMFEQNATTLSINGQDMSGFSHVLVMPAADRSLEDIYQKERPSAHHIQAMLHDVATALHHLHAQGLVHGDLKKHNILRVNGQLKLTDLDAATANGKKIGSKFSSGILPPEMFFTLENDAQKSGYYTYWEKQLTHPQLKQKYEAKKSHVVRSYKYGDTRSLPYELLLANTAIDSWSFGCMMYQMLGGSELVATDVNQDIANDEGMAMAANWTDAKLIKRIEAKIADSNAVDLLKKLLVVEPQARWTMDKVLSHVYFTGVQDTRELTETINKLSSNQLQMVNIIDDLQSKIIDAKILQDEAISRVKKCVQRMKQSTAERIFEIHERKVPSSYVVLPFKLDSTQPNESARKTASFMGHLWQSCKTLATNASDSESLSDFVAGLSCGEPLNLYLIDELTCEIIVPLEDDKIYPIEIPQESVTEFLKESLPAIKRGFKYLKTATSACEWIQRLGLNGNEDAATEKDKPKSSNDEDTGWIDDAMKLLDEPNASEISLMDIEGNQGFKVGGFKLRQLEQLLKAKDPMKTYCGLERILTSDGDVFWTRTNELFNHVSCDLK